MRADRLLSILLLLQVNRRLTARELARRLEVSERTILRDMDALSVSGVPVVAERGAGGGWSLMEEYQTRLTGLSPAEIQSLFLARPPKLLADLGLKQQAEAAWIKLHAALPESSRAQAEFVRGRILFDPRGWRDPAESIACLPVLLDALWRERRVRFVYQGIACEAHERSVDPQALVARGSTWYLIANVENAPRTYRVSRMRDAVVLEDAATRIAGFDVAEWWERSSTEFRERLPRYHATFLADPEAMKWIRYRGWRLEEEVPEGERVRVRIRFDVEEEAVQFALGLGGRVDVVEPAALRELVLAGARAVLGNYVAACR
jgi:predicted DNA-binding transcriptional regulator YafY